MQAKRIIISIQVKEGKMMQEEKAPTLSKEKEGHRKIKQQVMQEEIIEEMYRELHDPIRKKMTTANLGQQMSNPAKDCSYQDP